MRHAYSGRERLVLLGVTMFLACPGLFGAATPARAAEKPTVEQAIQLQRTWLDLLVAAKWKDASDMMAPELLWIHPTGRVDTRDSRMEALIKGPQPAWGRIDTKDIRADAFANAAVVTSETSWTSATLGAGETTPRVLHLRLTTMWVNEGGRWRVVRFQCTTIPPAA